jgi:hypothetical protein
VPEHADRPSSASIDQVGDPSPTNNLWLGGQQQPGVWTYDAAGALSTGGDPWSHGFAGAVSHAVGGVLQYPVDNYLINFDAPLFPEFDGKAILLTMDGYPKNLEPR